MIHVRDNNLKMKSNNFNFKIKYYKITNKEENHYGYQYVDGLNILKEEFNDNQNDSCCEGGFYFTTLDFIHDFYDYGVYKYSTFSAY